MKNILTLAIMFVIATNINGQKPGDKLIYDSHACEGIPYATVKVLGKMMGICANDKGWFHVTHQNSDSLLVSCVGYQTVIVKAERDTIFLTPSVISIGEVTVKPHKIKEYDFGYAYLKRGLCPLPCLGDENKINFTEIVSQINITPPMDYYKIKGVKMKVENASGKPIARLHIYKPDNNGVPGIELLPKDIIINTSIKNNYIDLSYLDIYSNAPILFVGFEFIITDKKECKYRENRISFWYTESIKQSCNYARAYYGTNNYKWIKFDNFVTTQVCY
ncbi:MAG: carboxypeptidase-like regulatory domain-containing protein [Paludibacter sp.]|nr:carboxypeptidase-like regulatory domain-containing protein [Paludibacter sp.]